MSNDTAKDQANQTKSGNRRPARSMRDAFFDTLPWVVPIAVLLVIKLSMVIAQYRPYEEPNKASRYTICHVQTGIKWFEEYKERLPRNIFGPTKTKADGSRQINPLLSWRVQLLPFIERRDLYERFHLDEPWDSPHNRKLIPEMPPFFRSPCSEIPENQYRTNYVAVTGKEGHFLAEGFGGTKEEREQLICLVEVNDFAAPVWTRPYDLIVDRESENTLDHLRDIGKIGFIICCYHGYGKTLRPDISAEEFYRQCVGAEKNAGTARAPK